MDDALLELGWVSKVHGLRGDVIVHALSNIEERFAAGAVVSLVVRGASREVSIASSKPYGKDLLIHFKGLDSREDAESLKGAKLYGEPLDYGDELLVHQLIGLLVREVNGTQRGVVVSVEANPASDLLVLDSHALVPLTFVVDIVRDDSGSGEIVIDPPEGLFDL
jgi:16S rRNA processing protein RimM